jgi:molybdopterin converting factor small subunit
MSSVPDIVITPIIAQATGSIYAQVKEKIDLKVVTEGKTDEEVKEELEEGLKKKGYKDPRVKVSTDSEGQRRIVIKNVELSEGDEKVFETMEMMELLVGEGGKIEIKSPVKEELDIDTEGKTNEQIKEELEKKLAERGMKNPKITIKDRPDGKREINVEVEEEKEID